MYRNQTVVSFCHLVSVTTLSVEFKIFWLYNPAEKLGHP